jgi:glycosyltransferase involved in cell wall biosynthesis
MKHNILFISSWYPTKYNPTLGNFVFKHAECVSKNNQVRAIHICLDSNITQNDFEFSEKPFPSKVIYLKKSTFPIVGKLIDNIRIIKTYLEEYKLLIKEGFTPDLVHANVVFPIGIIAWIYHIRFNVNYVISEHWTGYHEYADPRPGFIQRCITRFVANRAKVILPVSDDLGKAMIKHKITSKIITVANVIDTNLFSPILEQKKDEIIRIIHISTLENIQKNINLLLEAFATVSQKNSKLELHIISDGNLNDFKTLIEKLGIASKIINHGRLDTQDVADVLKQADLFVLTSNFENLPCVLIESISCGVPVIATNVGGVSEIINKNNGIIIEPRQMEELVIAMREMIEKHNAYDKVLLHKMAAENYSYEAIGNQLTQIYLQVLSTQKN